MSKKEFQSESKRLLDMMIHSIYTHKEIFLRELISNASDATDKYYYNAMQDGETGVDRESLAVRLTIDREKRTLTLSDKGCGMTQEEMEQNLGTIAHSGSLAFKKGIEQQSDVDIIGQFGVGFYAAFMVSKHVEVISRAADNDTAYRWTSDGAEGYEIEPATRDERGTDIVLYIKDNTDIDNYDEYVDEYRIQSIVKKYSDYIRYPIQMEVTRSRPIAQPEPAEGEEPTPPRYEEYKELSTLNSMTPIWKKAKSELTDEDYNSFYKTKFYDYEDSMLHIHTSTEGAATYNALLFVPRHAPFDYYTKDFEKGLQLYSNGVLIMEKCADLLPDHFSFIRGLVDSADLSLNISRELLQHDRHLKAIAASLEKKIKNELMSLQKNKREEYETLFKAFGRQMKYGAYAEYGQHKDLLADLLLYHSTADEKLVSFAEYVSRMQEGQKNIYYACGETVAKIEMLPQIEQMRDKGYEVLCLTDDVDEFCIKMMASYDEKPFKSIAESDLDLDTEEEKEEMQKLTLEHQDVLTAVKNALGDKVEKVQLTDKLKKHPCCIATEGGISLEMEKVLSAQNAEGGAPRAQRVLQLNANHAIFAKISAMQQTGNMDTLGQYANILYTQALLIEGMPIDDPVGYANAVCSLLA